MHYVQESKVKTADFSAETMQTAQRFKCFKKKKLSI